MTRKPDDGQTELEAMLGEAAADNNRLRAEIERLKAEKTEMADAILQIGGLSEVYFRTLVSFEIAEFIFTERTAALDSKP
jgi:hypothetical protein